MICATVAICIAVLTTLFMQRLNLKDISRQREAAGAEAPTALADLPVGMHEDTAAVDSEENMQAVTELAGSSCEHGNERD